MSITLAADGAATDPDVRDRILGVIDRWAPELVGLSHSLHKEPEVGLEEYRSRDKISALLRSAGFEVAHPAGSPATALVARCGSGELVIALCAEYDALPGIGHACGHNVNGAAAVGGAVGLASMADRLGLTVKLIGTPAEESTGGKIDLLRAGAFDGVAAAMMVHANGSDEVGGSSYALALWDVRYTGKGAHAAAAPWCGVNAADAVTLAYQAVGLLRQQLPVGQIVSFIIHEAGQAPNIIPAGARASVELRASSMAGLEKLQEAVRRCLQAGALATGAELAVSQRGGEFAELRQDPGLTGAYVQAMATLGRIPFDAAGAPRASTDMGNVSQHLPSIQPMIGYDVGGAVHHTPQFTEHGITPSADLAVLDGARGLALAGAIIAADPAQRKRLLDQAGARKLVTKPHERPQK
ncbi:amidohydrolase [Arthrobacter sp. A2-55]|uniref:amidohydrolase n=1 Tax=Arthrobacter sp. A2-55 TaxID=2897337 RepID=UPI0021CD9F80|nr:amidohydrolase [Arthrobacter sp. A2-55]MCU6479974.1 amidohydrolase [Arthrobacter sp. A2-55]